MSTVYPAPLTLTVTVPFMSLDPTVTTTLATSPSRIVLALASTLESHGGTMISLVITDSVPFSSTYFTVRLCLPGRTPVRFTLTLPSASVVCSYSSPSINTVTLSEWPSGNSTTTFELFPVPTTSAVIFLSTFTFPLVSFAR